MWDIHFMYLLYFILLFTQKLLWFHFSHLYLNIFFLAVLYAFRIFSGTRSDMLCALRFDISYGKRQVTKWPVPKDMGQQLRPEPLLFPPASGSPLSKKTSASPFPNPSFQQWSHYPCRKRWGDPQTSTMISFLLKVLEWGDGEKEKTLSPFHSKTLKPQSWSVMDGRKRDLN